MKAFFPLSITKFLNPLYPQSEKQARNERGKEEKIMDRNKVKKVREEIKKKIMTGRKQKYKIQGYKREKKQPKKLIDRKN